MRFVKTNDFILCFEKITFLHYLTTTWNFVKIYLDPQFIKPQFLCKDNQREVLEKRAIHETHYEAVIMPDLLCSI